MDLNLHAVFRPSGVSPALQFIVISVGTMLMLALLDFLGAIFAKEWADGKHPLWFVAGLVTFGILFAFYAFSLKTAELSVVTIGWVVFLQVGLVLYERFRFGASLPPLKWAAILVILALQAYLVLVPNEPGATVATEPTTNQIASERGG